MSLPSDVLEDKRSRAGERSNYLGHELKPDHVMKFYRSHTVPTRQIETQNNEVNDNQSDKVPKHRKKKLFHLKNQHCRSEPIFKST